MVRTTENFRMVHVLSFPNVVGAYSQIISEGKTWSNPVTKLHFSDYMI